MGLGINSTGRRTDHMYVTFNFDFVQIVTIESGAWENQTDTNKSTLKGGSSMRIYSNHVGFTRAIFSANINNW